MKNLKYLTIFTLLLSAISLSGCLHIIEEITIKKDGTGSYSFKVDASEITKMLGSMVGKAKKNIEADSSALAVTAPASADSVKTDETKRQKTLAHLKTQSGINNVLEIVDTTNFITGYSFDFDNVTHMKEALLGGSKDESMGLWSEGCDASLEKKAFKRKFSRSFTDIFMELMKKKAEEKGEERSSGEEFFRKMLGSMTLKQIYNFPDRKIKGSNDNMAIISTDKHSLSIVRKPFSDEKKAPDELKIRLK